MKHVTDKNHITKRKIKYRGICAAAAELGVTREHLYMTLEGRRSLRLERTEIFKRLKNGAA